MRITNGMTTNRLLLNINRNALLVDKYYTQLTSGKKIQMPSDDPIIASRALKFRTNIAETEQYKRNTSQGLSWMEVTEQGFTNTISIMKKMRDLCVQGSSDTFTYDDRQKIASEIQLLFEQLGTEMNISYAGRYVFSGYRTDQPPVINQNMANASYSIVQTFSSSDVETTKAYRKVNGTDIPEVFDVNIIKLPYKNMGDVTIPGYKVNVISANSVTRNPYVVAPGEINYIPEKGELVLSDDIVANFTGNLGVAPPMPPVMAAAPNPNASPYDNSGLDPNYISDLGTYNTLYSDYTTALASFNTTIYPNYLNQKAAYDIQYAEYQSQLARYEADVAKYNQEYAAWEANGKNPAHKPLDIMPQQPIQPVPPVEPTPFEAPVPPDPASNATNYAAYAAAYSQYLADVGTYQTAYDNASVAFGAQQANYENDLAAVENYRQFYDIFLQDTVNNTLPGYPALTGMTLPISPAYPPDSAIGVPPALSTTGTPYNNTMDPRYITDYNTYLKQLESYNQNMDHYGDYLKLINSVGTPGLTVQYNKNGLVKGDLNPLVYFRTTDLNTGVTYTMDNQNLQFEFGVNTRININNLAKDTFTATLYADLLSVVSEVNNVSVTTESQLRAKFSAPPYSYTGDMLETAIQDQIKDEKQEYRGVMQDRFSNMLALIDRHSAQISTEYTNLGSRMNRLELIQNRLEEDRVSYTALMSDNEDVDYLETIMRLNSAESVYQAAMKAGAGIMQLTLSDFIR